MWRTAAEAETTAPPTVVWQFWTDVVHWPRWNPQLAWSRLDGPFAVGSTGVLKPHGGPAARFTLTEVQPNYRWAAVARLPGMKLALEQEARPTAKGTWVWHQVTLSGWLAPVVSGAFGHSFRTAVPQAVRNLAALASAGEPGAGAS